MTSSSFSARLKARSLTRALPASGQAGPALAAKVLWLAAGLSAGHWMLQTGGQGPLVPVAAVPVLPMHADAESVAKALGAGPEVQAETPVAPPLSSRFRLIGWVSQPRDVGAALISVDGQAPRPFAVGAVVDGQLVLQSVGRQGARLGVGRDAPSAVELSLPIPPQ